MPFGLDVGTYNIVSARRIEESKIAYKREVNAFIELRMENPAMFNMMNTCKVPLVAVDDENLAYVLGEAAVSVAYAMPQVELKRPMKDGCLNPKEKEAQQILSWMVHGLVEDAQPGDTVFYSVPANATNEETDADWHSKVVERMLVSAEGENGPLGLKVFPLNEGLALVYAELAEKSWTGIGISFGAGMVNLCYSVFGAPVFKFSLVNSGDWIDKMASKAIGEETTTYVNQEKLKTDLSADNPELVQRAIKAQYEIMIQKTVSGIKKALEQTDRKARTNAPVDIVVSGGTSSPNGFPELFETILRKANLPLQIGRIIRPKDPLYSVARGCLIAAENSQPIK